MATINCRECCYFYITTVSLMPYGCRLFGFYGQTYPPQETLYRATGKLCDQGQKKQKTENQIRDENSKAWLA